jgi:ABC-type nitrate/sulfonate/bicarbonate transport system permease component
VIAGYVMGCGIGFITAILVDRSPFWKGVMPVGNLMSALPIIGIAPIMVMWFGFDWQSKAAVVVVMTFFPMLVNTVAGSCRRADGARPDAHLCILLLADTVQAAACPPRCRSSSTR